MYSIEICPVKRLKAIAGDADMQDVAALLVSSYPLDATDFSALRRVSVHHFHDVADPAAPGAFTPAMAEEIRRFLLSLPEGLDTLFVCCDSGQSRSSAMAAAITRYWGGDDRRIWRDVRYRPNPWVYRSLCTALGIPVTEQKTAALQRENEAAFHAAIARQQR